MYDNAIVIKPHRDVYVTRNTCSDDEIDLWPTTVGIRKFHGCIEWGAAWQSKHRAYKLNKNTEKQAGVCTPAQCKKRYGFIPRKGTAWLVEYNARGKMKKTKVDLAFSP